MLPDRAARLRRAVPFWSILESYIHLYQTRFKSIKGSATTDTVKIYEGHFRSNITVPVTWLCMIQFSKTIPRFVRLYITYKMVKSETKNACWALLGIPIMRYERAARPCALNFRLAALKCRFGRPPNALSSVCVWPSMPPLCASFIQNVITLTWHLFIRKKMWRIPNTVTCLLISNCSGKQTD